MTFSTEWEAKGVYRRFSGLVSGEEILKSNFEIHEDERFSSIYYIINDFSAMEKHSIQLEHTSVYATTDKIIARSKGRLKIALVIANVEQELLAQHYRQLMIQSMFKCEIFPDSVAARGWVESELGGNT